MIGIKIKNVGMLINPKLNGALILRKVPEIPKPIAPIKENKNPMAAEVPIATFIG